VGVNVDMEKQKQWAGIVVVVGFFLYVMHIGFGSYRRHAGTKHP
jgi:hypothetical protein